VRRRRTPALLRDALSCNKQPAAAENKRGTTRPSRGGRLARAALPLLWYLSLLARSCAHLALSSHASEARHRKVSCGRAVTARRRLVPEDADAALIADSPQWASSARRAQRKSDDQVNALQDPSFRWAPDRKPGSISCAHTPSKTIARVRPGDRPPLSLRRASTRPAARSAAPGASCGWSRATRPSCHASAATGAAQSRARRTWRRRPPGAPGPFWR